MSSAKIHPQLNWETPLKKRLARELEKHSHCLVLGPLPLNRDLLEKALADKKISLVIFIDGGLRHKKYFHKIKNRIQTLSLGDCDSFTQQVSHNLDFQLPINKDISDLGFLLSTIRSNTRHQIKGLTLLGFSAQFDLRLDHLLFNLGEVQKLVKKKKITTHMDNFSFYPAGEHSIKFRGLFSLLGLTQSRVKLGGKIKYPLKEWTRIAPLSSLGLSNVASGNIILETTSPLILYFPGSKIN